MANDYTTYRTQVSVLTPLHIGSGRDLLLEYDYAVHGKYTWRINEDALLEAQDVSEPALANRLARTPPGQLLKDTDFKPDMPFFHYVLSGTPRSQEPGAQLREQIKDSFFRPYLPGSSLKGALRTALVYHGFPLAGLDGRKALPLLKRNAKWAAQDIEHQILGKDPNHDLLRALQVSDSQPVGNDRLMLINAQVVTRGSTGAPIELETIRPDTVFDLTIKVDNVMFSDWAQELGFGSRAVWLEKLPALVQNHTTARARAEFEWFKAREGGDQARDFYRELAGLRLGPDSCVLQLGWGGGWSSKTLGDRISGDERLMESIINDYRLARGRRERGDPFPKSRRTSAHRIRSQNGETIDRIGVPLGWVLVEMKGV